MRTTIELPEKIRAELLKLSAQRGLKGFSQIIQEALNFYFETNAFKKDKIKKALKCKGALTDKEGEEFEEVVSQIRNKWR